MKEPDILRLGKEFGALVQSEWLKKVPDQKPLPEHSILDRKGKRGRIDVFLDFSDDGDYVTVIELKATDWDKIKSHRIVPNLRRHIKQVLRYTDTYLEDGLKPLSVCAGLIYAKSPSDIELKRKITEYLNEEGIQCVWHDESAD